MFLHFVHPLHGNTFLNNFPHSTRSHHQVGKRRERAAGAGFAEFSFLRLPADRQSIVSDPTKRTTGRNRPKRGEHKALSVRRPGGGADLQNPPPPPAPASYRPSHISQKSKKSPCIPGFAVLYYITNFCARSL